MSNLKSVLGENKKNITLQSRLITIYPIKVRNLPVVLDKIHLFKELKSENIMEIISKNFSEVVELLSSIANLEKEFVDELELSEMIELVEAVIEMNKEGFFLILKKLETINKPKTATGQKQSNSSFQKTTHSKESRTTA